MEPGKRANCRYRTGPSSPVPTPVELDAVTLAIARPVDGPEGGDAGQVAAGQVAAGQSRLDERDIDERLDQRPTDQRTWALPHRPGLDGLRGLAVIAVLGYHLGFGWLHGGFLGVSLFFTLSGFLITNLLLAEREGTGGVGLKAFWGRRARRLLPAALVGILLAVGFAALAADADQLRRLPGDVLGAGFYVANWRFVFGHTAYQAGYQSPSPLLHYWSLAIEEQLYLFLPLLVVVVFRFGRGRSRQCLAAAVAGLMVASAVAMMALGRSADPNRVYFGTDTRMFELLAGALLALAIGLPTPTALGRHLRPNRRFVFAGVVVAAITVALWATTAQADRWLYRGGLWGVAALSCGLIMAALEPGPISAALSWRPLTVVGLVSYGVYVYHWPIFLFLDGQRTGLHGAALVVVRLAVTGAAAWASYRWLEIPIRQRRWHLPRPAVPLVPALPLTALAAAVLVAGLAPARAIAGVQAHRIVLSPSLVASAATSPAAASPRPTTVAPVPPLSRVLFVGDSLVQQAYATFAARLEQRGIQARTIGGFGQSLMTKHGIWLTEIQQAVAGFNPDVVVLESCCGNFNTAPPWVGTDGRPLPPDTPEFYSKWRALATSATELAASRGATILWVMGPPTHTNGWYGPIEGRIPPVNDIYQSIVSCASGAGVVDWRVISASDGSYAAALPNSAGETVQVRTSDGFHFTPAGIDLQADITLTAINHQWTANGGRSAPWGGGCAPTGQTRRTTSIS